MDYAYIGILEASGRRILGEAAAVHTYHAKNQAKRVEDLNRKAENFERQGKPIPEHLKQSIIAFNSQARDNFTAAQMLNKEVASYAHSSVARANQIAGEPEQSEEENDSTQDINKNKPNLNLEQAKGTLEKNKTNTNNKAKKAA